MAPFSMRCMTCGEFIYRGRKFNSRKVTNVEQRYLGLQIYLFHIKCTRCSAEITFRTDLKNCDYDMVKGAVRTMEPWRNREAEEETTEQRLDRLEREEAEAAGEEERNAMVDLEAKNADTRREMAVADALDEIRHRNARINRSEKDGVDYADLVVRAENDERARQDREDEETARRAFAALAVIEEPTDLGSLDDDLTTVSPAASGAASMTSSALSLEPATAASNPTFKRVFKKKKDHSALLGIKKKPDLV